MTLQIPSTPKELYEWSLENNCENYSIMINNIALDYEYPTIDDKLKVIDYIF